MLFSARGLQGSGIIIWKRSEQQLLPLMATFLKFLDDPVSGGCLLVLWKERLLKGMPMICCNNDEE